MNGIGRRIATALGGATLIVALGAPSAMGAPADACVDPDDVPSMIESLLVGERPSDPRTCRQVCKAFAKACQKVVAINAKCVDSLLKPMAKADIARCEDDEECRKSVKDSSRFDREDARDDARDGKTTCQERVASCFEGCVERLVEDD